ncbi:MAG: hypothetical protein K6G10_01400 [Butyrivibrio sp.]|nr:hypothetical protein [Butyrivibrio sp.]
MTKKQEKTIKYIENMLEIKYNGKTDHDAWQFIHNNLKYAQKCGFFESQMSIPVFSSELGTDKEPELDLKRDISKEMLIRDIQHGATASEAMEHFAKNLFLENNQNVLI